MIRRVSPGSRVTRVWRAPIGCHPRAMESVHCPFSTATGWIPSTVGSQKGIAVGIETGKRLRAGKIRKVVTSFTVLRLVINDPVLDLHLADRIIALEVIGIIHRVPQAEFNGGEDTDRSAFRLRWLVSSMLQISRFCPGGTKYRMEAAIPSDDELMRVYPIPCRHS